MRSIQCAARAPDQAHRDSILLARGTTHRVMSPWEFMQRPAALVQRRRLHLIRLHGAPSPNTKLRANLPKRITDRSAMLCGTLLRRVDVAAAVWDEGPADIVCS